MGESLYNSHYCRLCAENNSNGELLFASDESEGDLGSLINRYLPLQVKDDGKFPRTICPGCNIQLQSTCQFFELLVEGQKKLREMWKEQVELEKKKKLEGSANDIEIEATRVQGEDGNIYMMITVPSEKSDLVYTDDNQLALRMEGLEKPRKKRGRPPKPKINPEEFLEATLIEEPPPQEPEEPEDENYDGRLRRRRRKIPSRYRDGAVVGPELERIFREEGVIDPDEDNMLTEDGYEEQALESLNSTSMKEDVKEVIGHMETSEGQNLGQLVVISKSRPRGSSVVVSSQSSGRRGRKKQTTVISCEICGKTFTNRSKLHMHRLDHKWNFECVTCAEKFSDKESLDAHQTTLNHEGMVVLEDKAKTQDLVDENSEEELGEEEGLVMEGDETTVDVSTCVECKKSYITKENLEDHIKAIHQGLRPYSCTFCKKKFGYPNSLKIHISVCHDSTTNENNSDLNSSVPTVFGSKNCTCDICGKVLNHPSSVIYHKESEHSNGRRYCCNKCDKTFKHKQLLQRHQLVHTEERPYECSSCTASFKTRSNLINHLSTHTGEKKFFCDLCGQQFAHKTSLTLHYRWHTGEKPFNCKICGKNFSQNGNLMEHMRIHTGEKPFFCNFCGRRFTTSSQFKLHLKRHTGEKPWKCEFCGKAFLHKDTWKCHVRRHRGERPYTCEYCNRAFTEQWALKKHLRIHTGEKPYSCDFCGKSFSDCSNLAKHKKVHRGATQEQELKVDGDGVVWQLVQAEGEEEEEGDEQAQHIIYVTYQNDTEEVDGGEAQTAVGENVAPNLQVLQQLTQGNNSLVLGTPNGEEVILSTLGGNLPMVVPSDAQLQLAETGSSSGTIQMASSDGGMTMPVTLTMEDGQLVAHIPSGSHFLPNNKNEVSNPDATVTECSEVRTEDGNLQIQLVTEDGRAVQLISTSGDASSAAFSIS